MKIKEEQIIINGLSVNYAVSGDGAPMILLHNGGGFWQIWEHQINYFNDKYKVYALDWPSFGGSDTPDGLLTMELLYETLREFIDQKELEKTTLIGNCIGASAAYLYTQRHPEKVSELVLFNICPGDLIFPKFIFRKLIPALNEYPGIKKVAEKILKFSFLKTPVKKRFPPILFGDQYDEHDPLFKYYVEKFKTDKQTSARINLLFSVHTYTFRDYLAGSNRIPHLLLWGSENSVTSYKKHGKLHGDWLQPDKFEVIPKSGHLCMYESPDLVNKILNNYFLPQS